MRRNRLLLGLSIRDAAERAGISKNTILRVESGLAVQRASRTKLCRAYGCVPVDPESRVPASNSGKYYTAQKRLEQVWYATRLNPDGKTEAYTNGEVQAEDERNRLGVHGLVNHFGLPLRCRRERTRFIPFLMELYRPTDASSDPSGERFTYCLRGSVRIQVGDESFVLEEGEASCHDATVPHLAAPLETVKRGEPAPLVLQILVP